MTTLQEQHDQSRKLYMSKQKSHLDHYWWLGDAIGITDNDVPTTIERLVNSKDDHFNDIPLTQWDQRDYIVQGKARRAGMRIWSLSDTVCVLKARAARMKTNALVQSS
jgi:hypothetical protein